MVWTPTITWVDGNMLTAGELNTYLRDNMLETMPGKVTGQLQHFITKGANQIEARQISASYFEPTETTVSTSYTNLNTVGPSVTAQTGNFAIVMFAAYTDNTTANVTNSISIEGTGTSADDSKALIIPLYTAEKGIRLGLCHLYDSVTPGINTFTLKYKTSAGTAKFGKRLLIVIAL